MDQTPDQFCRLCLNQNPPYFSIFENQAPDMFESLTSIKISVDDPAPDILCLQCLAELKNAYTVQQKFIQTQKYWLERVRAAMKPASTVYVKQENEESEVKECDTTKEYLPSEEVKCEADIREMADLDEAMFDSCKDRGKEAEELDVPDDILLEAEELNRSIPEKTRDRYEKEMVAFDEWREKKGLGKAFNQTLVLAYLCNLAKTVKASSLWTKFSMLKKVLIVNNNVDISRFRKVMAFMKSQTIVSKKFKTLSVEQCCRFIAEASDDFLLSKVVLIFGLYGACGRDELIKLTVDDIEDHDKYALVKLRDSRTQMLRSFIIPDASSSMNPYGMYRKYARLRPRKVETRRFFLGYRNGKCVAQPAGQHTVGAVPRKVAEFLGLENPKDYTGHSLRRSGARVAQSRGNFLPKVADEYAEEATRAEATTSRTDWV